MRRTPRYRAVGWVLIACGIGIAVSASLFRSQSIPAGSTRSQVAAQTLSKIGEPNEGGTIDEPEVMRITQLRIDYPQHMRENESLPVKLRFEVGFADPVAQVQLNGAMDAVEWSEESDTELEVHLVSTGFDVAPVEKFLLNPGDSLPAHFDWTISPKQEGTHHLRLSFRDAQFREREIGLVEEKILLNERPLQRTDGGSLFLPIQVATFAGVSRLLLAGTGTVIAFIGFVLTWDVIVTFIKRKAGMVEEPKDDNKEREPSSQ